VSRCQLQKSISFLHFPGQFQFCTKLMLRISCHRIGGDAHLASRDATFTAPKLARTALNPSPGLGGHVLGDQRRCRLVPSGESGKTTTYNSSIGPVLRGSSCAVILVIKKTTRELCARTPPTPAPRAAPGMPLSGVGGLLFAVDPQLSADNATVFW